MASASRLGKQIEEAVAALNSIGASNALIGDCGRDPYEALDALMVVVEALCPEWPPRYTFAASSWFIL